MSKLIVNSFPIRVNLYTGTGRQLFGTSDNKHALRISGGTVSILPMSYYSSEPQIDLNISIASRANFGRLNAYYSLAVYENIIAYIPSDDDEVIAYINKSTLEEIARIPVEDLQMPTVGYLALCNYRGKPAYIRSNINSIGGGMFEYRAQIKRIGSSPIIQNEQVLFAQGPSFPNNGIGIADFNNPISAFYKWDGSEVGTIGDFGNDYNINYAYANDLTSLTFAGLADVQSSPLVQTWISNLTSLKLDSDFVVTTDDDRERLYTRGVRVGIKLPRIAKDIVDRQILDNSSGNVNVLRYWTNGNNFGVFVHYTNLNRTYLYVAHTGQDLTAATINYNF